MNKLGLSTVTFVLFAAAVSCGGRTGDLSPDVSFNVPDSGQGGASGGAAGVGKGGVATGGHSAGGRPPSTGGHAGYGAYPSGGYGGYGYGGYGYGGYGYGGYGYGGYGYGGYGYGGYAGYGAYGGYGYGGYAGYGAYGGYGYGGYAGYGAYGGYGYGGYAGYGGSGVCAPPYCDCYDSCSSCYCYGNDPSYCSLFCQGAAGAAGAAGGSASLVCPLEVCPSDLPSSCCTDAGYCGVDIPPSASQFGIATGCQALNQPGNIDYGCPSLGSLAGQDIGGFEGCCRPDGTCGIYVGTSELSLGCIQETYDGVVRLCGAGGSVATGGVGGATGVGGTFAVGGFGGSGGSVATGGVAGAAAQQCVSQARSDCERCACGSCYDSLIPCFKDAGCPQILACANRTGCLGLDCYQPGVCQDVIDTAGGLNGASVNLALPLFVCVTNLNCPCGFK